MTTLGIDILRRSAWSLGEGSRGIWWNTWEKSIFDSMGLGFRYEVFGNYGKSIYEIYVMGLNGRC